MPIKRKNLLAARIEPWQLFKFRKIVEWRKMRPGFILMEALQIYSNSLKIPKELISKWLKEYNEEAENVD